MCNYVENITDNTDNIIYYNIDYQDWNMTDIIEGCIVFKYENTYYRLNVDVKYDTDSYSDMVADECYIEDCSLYIYDNLAETFEYNRSDLYDILGKVWLDEYGMD